MTLAHALALLFALAQDSAAEDGVPGLTVLPAEPVVLEVDVSLGWPRLEVWVDDQGPFAMILDTGAGGLVLDADLARRLELPVVGSTRIGDPSDPTANEVDLVQVETLELGGARFEEIQAVAWDRPPELQRPGFVGIVGWPVFAECLLTIDRAGGQVRLERGRLPEPDGASIVAYQADAFGALTLPIEVAGVALDAHLDSGNSGSVSVPARLLGQIPIVAGTERKGVGRRASGPIEFTSARLDGSIRVGGIVMEGPEVRFDSKLEIANLGATFLDHCVLTVDQATRRMRMVPHAAPAGAAAPEREVEDRSGQRRLGVRLVPTTDGRLTVAQVEPGSLAEQVGLAGGDVLLTVAGAPVTARDTGALVDALAGGAAFALEVRRGEQTVELEVPAP